MVEISVEMWAAVMADRWVSSRVVTMAVSTVGRLVVMLGTSLAGMKAALLAAMTAERMVLHMVVVMAELLAAWMECSLVGLKVV